MQTVPNCDIHTCTVCSFLPVSDGPFDLFDDEYINDLKKIHNDQVKPFTFKYGYNFTEVTSDMLRSSLYA